MCKISAILFLAAVVTVKAQTLEDKNLAVQVLVSNIKIVNSAASNIVSTQVSETVASEWAPPNAPFINFQNVQIESGASAAREADLNANAQASHYTMAMTFADNSQEVYRINQRHAFDGSADFEHRKGTRTLTYGVTANHTLAVTIRE